MRRSRMAKLNSIIEALKTPECQVIYSVLMVIKARSLKRFRVVNNQITDAVNEAKDNVKCATPPAWQCVSLAPTRGPLLARPLARGVCPPHMSLAFVLRTCPSPPHPPLAATPPGSLRLPVPPSSPPRASPCAPPKPAALRALQVPLHAR